MRANLSIKYHADNRNRIEIEEISSSLGAAGIETVCIARDLENWGKIRISPETLMKKSITAINECDFSLVELSETGAGIGTESGYA